MFEESASAIPSSIWESMNSWFTPTVLFVLLNVMIGTIAFTSTLTHQNHHHQTNPNQHNDEPKICRSPSVLQRLKSINFSPRSQNFTTVPDRPNPDSDTLEAEEHAHQAQSHYFFPETPPQLQAHYIFNQPHEHTSTQEETQPHFVFEQGDSSLMDFQEAPEEEVEENIPPQSLDEVYSQFESHFVRTKSDTEPSSGKIPVKLPAKIKKSASSKSAFGHFEEEDIVEARRPATVREMGVSKVTDSDEEVDAKADDFINRFKQQLKVQRLDSITRYKEMIGRGS